MPSRLVHSQSDRQSDPGFAARGPAPPCRPPTAADLALFEAEHAARDRLLVDLAAAVAEPPPDPEPDRPTAAAQTELVGWVRAWLNTGMPTAADVAAWSRAFRALEASEWGDDTRWALGPATAAEGGGR